MANVGDELARPELELVKVLHLQILLLRPDLRHHTTWWAGISTAIVMLTITVFCSRFDFNLIFYKEFYVDSTFSPPIFGVEDINCSTLGVIGLAGV